MFGSVQKWFRHRHKPFVPAFYLILTVLLLTVPHLQAQTVATYDFEDGTTQGWSSFNGATTPVNTTAAAYSGSHSLLTTTSSSGSGGPSIALNSVLQPGAKYTITGYVMLTPGESATNANFTIKRSDPSCSGGTCYDTIGTYQVPVSDSGWVQIGGTYTASTTETGLTLYAQFVGATSAQSFYLDDVVITETAPPPGGTPIAPYNFPMAASTAGRPSAPLRSPTRRLRSLDPTGNTHSLLVTNRTAAYMGPSLNLLERQQRRGRRNLSGYRLCPASRPRQQQPHRDPLHQDQPTAPTTPALYGNLATSAVRSRAPSGPRSRAPSASAICPARRQPDCFTCSPAARRTPSTSAMSSSANSPPPRSVPASRTTPASPAPSKMAASMAGPRAPASSTLTNTTAAAHSGTHSLLTTGRSPTTTVRRSASATRCTPARCTTSAPGSGFCPPTAPAMSSTSACKPRSTATPVIRA